MKPHALTLAGPADVTGRVAERECDRLAAAARHSEVRRHGQPTETDRLEHRTDMETEPVADDLDDASGRLDDLDEVDDGSIERIAALASASGSPGRTSMSQRISSRDPSRPSS